MKIIYRISDAGYNKVKPSYVNNENCLKNASLCFKEADWLVIADNTSKATNEMISKYQSNVIKVSVGHGAGTFNLALDEALKCNDDEIVYFLENDYIHTRDAHQKLVESFLIGAEYVSLYDHPDKYRPYSEEEPTRVFLSNSTHWKLTNSTTMTFATRVKILREDESIIRKWTAGSHPHDFEIFQDLRQKGRTLITPIPSCSTHGETEWLSPLVDWKAIIDSSI